MARSNLSFRSISSRTKQLGQGMSEYLIIVALIAIAAIGVVGGMGGVVQSQVAGMANELAGTNATAQQAAATTFATGAATDAAAANNNLSNYTTAGANVAQ